MASLAEERGLAVTPRLNGALGMGRKFAATRTLELLRFWLALWKKPAQEGKHNDAHDNNSENSFL